MNEGTITVHLVDLGFACNNACVFCAQGQLRTTAGASSMSALSSQLEAIPRGSAVAFVGGEPTLHQALLELVRGARACGAADVLLQTNGRTLAAPGFIAELVAAGVSGLDVSLHGSTDAMHDYHTSVTGSFRQTVAGLRRACAERLPFGVTTVVTRSNYRHLSDVVRVAHALGARAVHLTGAVSLGSALHNRARVLPPPALARRHVEHALAVAEGLGLEYLGDARLAAKIESSAGVRNWFAGIGQTEPAERTSDVAPPPRPTSSESFRQWEASR